MGYAPLLEKNDKTGGRNNNGRITTRHIGGGHKHHYRVVDFKRNKDGIPAKVERLEYDPNRSANIALVLYADGERKYILAPKGIQAGIAGGVIAAAVVGSVIASNDTNTTPDGPGPVDPDPECSAGDDLVDGICYNVTKT